VNSWLKHAPNVLTGSRLVAALVLVLLLLRGHDVAALCVFIFAGITDAADGFLAKRWHFTTRLGRYLDPAADKLLMLVSFLTLTRLGVTPLWLTVLVIARDVVIVCGIGLAHYMALPLRVAPSILGKISTAGQVCYIGFILVVLAFNIDMPQAVYGAALLAGGLTLASWLNYAAVWLQALARRSRRIA
jgi:cardiolipin synthase